jgi:hypothetical protein
MPLPLIGHGGSAMLGSGRLISAWLHRGAEFGPARA